MKKVFVCVFVTMVLIMLMVLEKITWIILVVGEKIAWVVIMVRVANEVKKTPVGLLDGDRCFRGSCPGHLHSYGGVCTCFTGNAPCSFCTDGHVCCNACDYDSQEHGEGLDYDQDEEDRKFYSGSLGEPWEPGK